MNIHIQNLSISFRMGLLGAMLLVLPAVVQAQGYTYVTNSGTITITAYTGSGGAVVIPATINGLPVVEIGNFAFSGANLTSVTIPDSVISIDYEAFSYCDMANVTIGNNVTGISSFAFYDCPSLTSVTIPDSVTYIASFAFSDCQSLTNVIIGNSINNIGQDCFGGDTSLKSVTFGTNFASVQYDAFEDCTSLTGLYFKGDAPSFGSDVFYGDPTVTLYYLQGTTGWSAIVDGEPTALWIVPVPPALAISTYSNQPAVFFPTATGTNFVLQMTTNLASGNWVSVTNGIPISGLIITNPPAAAFFRLQSQ